MKWLRLLRVSLGKMRQLTDSLGSTVNFGGDAIHGFCLDMAVVNGRSRTEGFAGNKRT